MRNVSRRIGDVDRLTMRPLQQNWFGESASDDNTGSAKCRATERLPLVFDDPSQEGQRIGMAVCAGVKQALNFRFPCGPLQWQSPR